MRGSATGPNWLKSNDAVAARSRAFIMIKTTIHGREFDIGFVNVCLIADK